MRRGNRGINYRRSNYQKKRIKAIVITVAVSLITLILLIVIIGNALGNKVADRIESSKKKSAQTEEDTRAVVEAVNAYPVKLSSDDSRLSSRLTRIATDGYTDVCFELDSADGTLLYASKVAASLGRQAETVELWTLDEAIKEFDKQNLHAIGITHLSDFSSENDLERSAAIGYHAALIAEAIRAGVDDVLIYVGEIPTEQYDELIVLAKDVHRLCPEGVIGLSLPHSVLSDTDKSSLIDSLYSEFDYLAADLTAPTIEGDNAAKKTDAALGNMLYYLLRYNIRVLLPYTDDAELYSQITQAVTSNGSSNMQMMPQ